MKYNDVLSTIFAFLAHTLPTLYQILNLVFTKVIIHKDLQFDVFVFESIYLVSNFGISKLLGVKIYTHLEWTELASIGSIFVFTILVGLIYLGLV